MKKLLHGRPLLYTSIAIVCVYILAISLFTRSDILEAFFDVYIYVIVHILILYGIIWLADQCLQEQKPAVRTTIRIVFTVILILAQLPFVVTYLQELRHSSEALQWVVQQLRFLGFQNHRSASIELYQLPWILMLGGMFFKYNQSTKTRQNFEETTPIAFDASVNTALTNTSTSPTIQIKNDSTITNTNSSNTAAIIKLKTRRRLQTFGIFIAACAVFFVALFVGIAGAYSNRSHDPLESIGILLLFTSYGLFAWVGIRILLGIIRFFKSAILSSPTSANSFTTNRPQSNFATNVRPEENLIVERSEETKIAFNEETTNYADLLERGVSKEEIIANSAGKIVQTSTVEYFSFSSNQQDTSMKLQFIVVSVLAMVIRYILSLIIPFGAFQFAYFVDIFSVGINGFCFIYGLYYLITSRVNKGLSIIILFLPLVHFLILKIL